VIEEKKQIKVLIVDDHPIVRDGLKLFLSLSSRLVCVGEAPNGERAVQLCAAVQPDVVLMDNIMPDMSGTAATRQILMKKPDMKIIILTSFEEKGLVKQAIQAGAVSYLLKDCTNEMLEEAILAAYNGNSVISPLIMRSLTADDPSAPTMVDELTDREKEILVFLADGLTNFEIANKLYISEATARFHVSNILSKLGVSNRTQAVRQAIKYKMIGS
jgi:two-component system, NarL family, response regulator LiaR